MFRCVLFDLDGTLTDPKEGITKSVQFALYQQGIKEPDLDKLEPFIGPPLKDSFMDLYGMTSEQALTAIEDYRKRFAPIGIFENKVYTGIPQMLEKLKAAGMKLAVASSKPELFVNRILEHFELSQYFDVVVGSNLDGTRGKKEEVVEEALNRLGEKTDKITCAMVGDRRFDIQGAKEYGLTAVGVAYGYAGKGELEAAGADYIAKTVKQLEQFLLQNIRPDKAKGTEDKKSSSSFAKTLDILNCVLIYFIAYYACNFLLTLICVIVSGLTENANIWIYQNEGLVTNVTTACSMLGGAGFLIPIYRKEQKADRSKGLIGNKNRKIPFLRLGILAGTGALGVNILFFLLHLTERSASYQQTAQIQYEIPFLFGIVFYGVISPLAEELLFRGLIYNRMKQFFSVKTAMVASSLMFGMYHGNPVQALYGILLGLLIVYSYEVTESFLSPLLVHSVANVVVFSCTYHAVIGEAIGTPVNCVIFLTIFGVTFLKMKREMSVQ